MSPAQRCESTPTRALLVPGVAGTAGTLGDSAALSLGAGVNCTFTGWSASAVGLRPILLKGTSVAVAANLEYFFGNTSFIVGSNPQLRFSDGAALTDAVDTSPAIPSGKLSFYAATYNGANQQCTVNEGPAGTGVAGPGAQDAANSLFLGAIGTGGNANIGTIRMVGFWKRALTANELLMLYNGGKGCLARELPDALRTSIISYWDLQNDGNDYFGGNHWGWIGNGMQFVGGHVG